MSIGYFSISDAAISQAAPAEGTPKSPPKRQAVAKRDATVVPEPR